MKVSALLTLPMNYCCEQARNGFTWVRQNPYKTAAALGAIALAGYGYSLGAQVLQDHRNLQDKFSKDSWMQWEKAYPLSEESKVLKREFRRTQYDFESANRSLKAAKDQYGQIVAAPFEWTVKNVGALFDQVFGLGWVKDEGLEAAERVRACEKEVRIAEAPFVAAKAKYDDIQARIQSLEDKRQELFHKSISVRSLISSCFVDLPDNIKSDVPVLDTKQKALACGVYRIEEAFSQLKMRWFGG